MYEKPIVIDNNAMEGVYADSGDNGDWNGTIVWESHDSGQFSVIRIVVNSNNSGTYENITVTIQWTGVGNISTIWGSTYGAYISGPNQITLSRPGRINPYQGGIDCGGIQIKYDSPQYDMYYDGAEPKGEPPCSYYKSGEHCGEPAPYYIVSVIGG